MSLDTAGLSITQIKAALAGMDEITEDVLNRLSGDSRSGVRTLAEDIRRKREKATAREAEQERMLELERSYHKRGFERVAGVDEAGRGPLAGPVVAAAVIFPPDCDYPEARDSKKLPASRREELYDRISERALAVGTGSVDHEEIDRINIYQASLTAMYRALKSLPAAPDAVLVDGPMVLRLDVPQQAVTGGDAICLSVAAASIVAKVTRDRLMQQFDLQYPGYGFARHKGYGTADHLRALNELGPCPIHRRSFEVVAQVEKAKNTEKEVDMENMGSNLSDQYAFFLEALENSSTMNELDRIGSDIRLVRDSLTVEELNLLRAAYRRRKEILS